MTGYQTLFNCGKYVRIPVEITCGCNVFLITDNIYWIFYCRIIGSGKGSGEGIFFGLELEDTDRELLGSYVGWNDDAIAWKYPGSNIGASEESIEGGIFGLSIREPIDILVGWNNDFIVGRDLGLKFEKTDMKYWMRRRIVSWEIFFVFLAGCWACQKHARSCEIQSRKIIEFCWRGWFLSGELIVTHFRK